MNRNSSTGNFYNNSTHQISINTNEESREILLLRCKTTIDDLKDELERTERSKEAINIKFENLQKDYKIQERLLEEERALNQGIIDELNRIKGQVSLSINEQKELKLIISQKDKKILEQDVYIKTLCQKITIQDNIIQEYNNELGSKEQECSTLRQGQTESESYWAQSYNLLKISFNQKMTQIKEVEDKNKDLTKKVKDLEKQIEDIKNTRNSENEYQLQDKVKEEMRKHQKDHNEEVKKIKQESLEAYEEMQDIIKQHELQFSEIEKENVDLKLKIQQISLGNEKKEQSVSRIADELTKKEEEVCALSRIIKEQEELMGNFDNLIQQKEHQMKDKYYLDLQNVRKQLIELQESNMKVVKDSSKIKERHQQQLIEREKRISELVEKFKQMEIKIEKKDQEIKMLNERIKLIVTKKQKYKKKSLDLNTKYDVLDNQIRNLQHKMDQSFKVQENQQQSNEKSKQNQLSNEIAIQQKYLLKHQTGNLKYDSNEQQPSLGMTNAQKENLDNFLKTQERNPLAQIINNQRIPPKQQQSNTSMNQQSQQDAKQTLVTQRSSSTIPTGNQSLANIKEKLKVSAQNLQKIINIEASSQERQMSQQKSNQTIITKSKAPIQQEQQATIAQLDNSNNTRLIEMKRKMMDLEKAVKTKEIENHILKEEINCKKTKSSTGNLTRQTRALSQNYFN